MDDTVFDVFEQQEYTFLTIEDDTAVGKVIVAQSTAYGVFKLRNGMNVSNTQETKTSDATLHIKPDESFVSTGLIGHGIRYDGKDYEIQGVTEGRNFEYDTIEHYRVTLQATKFLDTEASS